MKHGYEPKPPRDPLVEESGKRDRMSDLVAELEVRNRTIEDLCRRIDRLEQQNRELRRAHETIDHARTRYFELYELSPVACIDLDEQGRIQEVNAAAVQMLAQPRARLLGRLLVSIVRFEDPPAFWRHLRRCLDEARVISTELAIAPIDGPAHFVIARSSFVARHDGRRICRTGIHDITDRHRAEAVRATLAALVESSDDAIIGTTPNAVVTAWNRAAERIFGYSADEMIGQPLLAIVPADRVGEMASNIERLRRGDRIATYETVRLRKDTTPIDVALTISPLVESGRLVGHCVVARDIGARKRAEREAHESHEAERRLRAQVEAVSRAHVAISEAVADSPKLGLVEVLETIVAEARALTSAEFAALGVGRDPNKPFERWVCSGLSPEQARALGATRADGLLGCLGDEDEPVRIDDASAHPAFRTVPPDHPAVTTLLGVPIWHRSTRLGNLYLANKFGGRVFTHEDERSVRMLVHRAGSAIEISQLTAAVSAQRAWLHAVIDQMPEAVMLADTHGRITYNRVALAISSNESESVDSYGNPHLVEVCLPSGERCAATDLPLGRALHEGDTTVGRELAIRAGDGRLVPVAASAAPVHDDADHVIGAVAVFQDISAIKDLERLRQEWTSIVAHDLRQPVTTIDYIAQLVLQKFAGTAGSEDRRHLQHLRAAVARLNRMIGDLFDSSRIETNRLTIERATVDAASFVRDVMERAAPLFANHALEVEIRGDGIPVLLDPARIEQVLVNLMTNAAKYGLPSSAIRLVVDRQPDGLEISVTNRGKGLTQDELKRVFMRFYRARAARERGTEGLGLGLYIAQGIVEAHGGRMFAHSTPGETTTFGFILPGSSSC